MSSNVQLINTSLITITFGWGGYSGAFYTFPINRKRASRFYLSGIGYADVASIFAYCYDTAVGSHRVAIYSDEPSTELPVTALAVSNFVSVPAVAGWVEFPITVTLERGRYYWLTLISSNHLTLAISFNTLAGYKQAFNDTGYTNPFGAATTTGDRLSLYAVLSTTPTLTLTKVLAFDEDESDEIAEKSVLGKGTPTVESDVYKSYPKTYTIVCRLTDAEKASLFDIQSNVDILLLKEDSTLLDYVFIEKVNSIYAGDEHIDSPWRVTINLVATSDELGLILYMPFNEDVYDHSITKIGPVTNYGASSIAGKINNARNFDGVSNYVSIPHNSLFSLYVMSISVWIKRTGNFGNERGIITKGAGWGTEGWSLYTTWDMKPIFAISDGADIFITSPNALPLNTWRHVVLTANGQNLYLYEDGQLVAGPIACTKTAGGNYAINVGRISQLLGNYIPAIIDEVRVYNRALSAAEILKQYNDGINA